MEVILFIGSQFSTIATSDYNTIASVNHTIEASAIFSLSWLLLNKAEASEQLNVFYHFCSSNILCLL